MYRTERREILFGEPVASPFGNLGAPAVSRRSWANIPRTIPGTPTYDPVSAEVLQLLTVAGVSKRVDTPMQPNSNGVVRAISIAPDSPLSACDIMLGGVNSTEKRHRISTMRPLFLDHVDSDFFHVAPIRRLPSSTGLEASSVTGADRSHFWDTGLISGQDGATAAWPLRLQLHRGEMPHGIAGDRAPGVGICTFTSDSSNSPTTDVRFYVITDGRRRFDVQVTIDAAGGGTHAVTIDGIEPTVGVGGAIADQWAIDNLATALSVLTTAPVLYSYQGNPYFMVRVRIISNGGNATGCITVISYDS